MSNIQSETKKRQNISRKVFLWLRLLILNKKNEASSCISRMDVFVSLPLCHKICCCYLSALVLLLLFTKEPRDGFFSHLHSKSMASSCNGGRMFASIETLNRGVFRLERSRWLLPWILKHGKKRRGEKPFAIILVFAHSTLLCPSAILWPHSGKVPSHVSRRHIKY